MKGDKGEKLLLGIVCFLIVLTVFPPGGFCLTISGDNVGIGTDTPTQPLEVNGNIKVSGTGAIVFSDSTSQTSAFALPYSKTISTPTTGFQITNNGSGNVINGISSSGGSGVLGESVTGNGVIGKATGSGGIGVYGFSMNGWAGSFYGYNGFAGYFAGQVIVTGALSAGSISGNGPGLTNLNGTNIQPGTISGAALASNTVKPANIGFYSNVAIVAPSGGDYNNPATAMSDYASWCPTPSAVNPCLLKIMPYYYTIGTSTVVMQNYIDIEGSGETVTGIQGNINSGSSGVVNGANNAELRFLTVNNTAGGTYAVAIYNGSASPKLTNVTATASGSSYNIGVYNTAAAAPKMLNVTASASGSSYNYGVYNTSFSHPTMMNVTATASGGSGDNIGVYNTYSYPTMMNVTATASGGSGSKLGVRNDSSSLTMMNVTATASGALSFGVYNANSSSGYVVKINHSVIEGTTTIYNGSGVQTLVGNTQLDGGPVMNSGALTCAGVYDENYVFYANTCP